MLGEPWLKDGQNCYLDDLPLNNVDSSIKYPENLSKYEFALARFTFPKPGSRIFER